MKIQLKTLVYFFFQGTARPTEISVNKMSCKRGTGVQQQSTTEDLEVVQKTWQLSEESMNFFIGGGTGLVVQYLQIN